MASSFLRASGAGYEQVGHVEAGDEKDTSGGGEKDIEWAADVADEVFEQRAGVSSEADVRIVAMLTADAADDDGEIGAGGGFACAGKQASDCAEFVLIAGDHQRGGLVVIDGGPEQRG